MERADEPSRNHLNGMADWLEMNFKADTQAIIMIMQLYWEPASNSTLSVSGVLVIWEKLPLVYT